MNLNYQIYSNHISSQFKTIMGCAYHEVKIYRLQYISHIFLSANTNNIKNEHMVGDIACIPTGNHKINLY